MRTHALSCAALLAALPALAEPAALEIDLLPGHPIYHEPEKRAGVAMALSVTSATGHPAHHIELCEELRVAAGLGPENNDELRLETIFVVPYKGMAVEGLYLPSDGTFGSNALVRGRKIARPALDRIVAQAGIPPGVLDERDVEHEVSCKPYESVWSIAWSDIREIGEEAPEVVIERARQRFLAVYQRVLEHNEAKPQLQETRRSSGGG
jgi:hypothetical protein